MLAFGQGFIFINPCFWSTTCSKMHGFNNTTYIGSSTTSCGIAPIAVRWEFRCGQCTSGQLPRGTEAANDIRLLQIVVVVAAAAENSQSRAEK